MQTVFTREMSSELFLVMQENGLNMQDVLIPEGIEEIAPGAFCGRNEIKRVKLPKTLKRISDVAFYGCSRLESIDLPKGTKEIGTAAFKGSGLT